MTDLFAASAEIMMNGGGGGSATERLKIIDNAPELYRLSFSENGWAMVFKKVDDWTQNNFQSQRPDTSTSEWTTSLIYVKSALVLCVYFGNKLKWIAEPSFDWTKGSSSYKFSSVSGESVYHKYQETHWGVAVGSDPNIRFVPDVLRITNVQPSLPTVKYSTVMNAGLRVSYVYDTQSINYDYDGTVTGTTYSTGITGAFQKMTLSEISIECITDLNSFLNDIAAFNAAVWAYVNK